jgi:hypothetical protein
MAARRHGMGGVEPPRHASASGSRPTLRSTSRQLPRQETLNPSHPLPRSRSSPSSAAIGGSRGPRFASSSTPQSSGCRPRSAPKLPADTTKGCWHRGHFPESGTAGTSCRQEEHHIAIADLLEGRGEDCIGRRESPRCAIRPFGVVICSDFAGKSASRRYQLAVIRGSEASPVSRRSSVREGG